MGVLADAACGAAVNPLDWTFCRVTPSGGLRPRLLNNNAGQTQDLFVARN